VQAYLLPIKVTNLITLIGKRFNEKNKKLKSKKPKNLFILKNFSEFTNIIDKFGKIIYPQFSLTTILIYI